MGTVASASELDSRNNVLKILQAYSRYGYTLVATRRALEAAMAGGRQAEQRASLKQRSLLVRFGRRGIEQLRGRPPSIPIVTIRLARSIGREAQQPHPSVGHAANITN